MNNLHALHDAYARLDQHGDPLKKLADLIDFEQFREPLEACWRDESKPERDEPRQWDAVLMFKILLLSRKTGASDESLEFAMTDSWSVMRFLGFTVGDEVPDRSTIARYRGTLDSDAVREVFKLFDDQLAAAGYVSKDRPMSDKTFKVVPIQRQTGGSHSA